MKFKKITSLSLAVACLMSTAVLPVHAAGETSDTVEYIDENLYNRFTIDFADMEDFALDSYTVLVPKTKAVTPNVFWHL